MNKNLIFSSGILIYLVFILCLSSVSASGLCLGNDGYYHDCDDNKYYDYNKDYEHSYYYHGKYYPTRDYYYREYYRPSCYGSRCNEDDGLTYRDTEEYKRTIEYNYENRGVSENIKYTIDEKTEINSHYDIPYMTNIGYYTNQNNNQRNSNADKGNWYDFLYDAEPVPYSNYWYEKN